jgi:Cation transporting ATPase, C-terminus
LSACPLPGDEPLISGLLWRNIIGQGVFQLGLMYALVTHGNAIFSVPAHASVDGPSVHYTIVFNIFVLLQLFNQVSSDQHTVRLYVTAVDVCR